MSGERPLSGWTDRRVAEHGRAICLQRTLPSHPEVASQQAAVLEEWARRWRQRGPRDVPGEVELGLVGELAAELRRIAAGVVRQPSPSGRPSMSDERPAPPEPRRLGEDQSLPGDFLVAFTKRLMDRRAQLLRQGQPPEAARERAVAEAVQTFTAGAKERGWTVTERRIASLADDTLGLEEEFRDQHGYEPELARLFATGEVLDGERARQELPAWLLPPGPPDQQERQPSGRTAPDRRTDSVRTREADGER